MKIYKKQDTKNIEKIINMLDNYYPNAICGLEFSTPLELVVALILAAQCTDARVNQIIPILFKKYPDVYALSKANIDDIQKIVKPCGFYVNKANSIYQTANIMINDFDGKVPDTMEKLCKLRGIGRKSANIILQECFDNTVGIAVDTHVTRISRKIGLSNSDTQEKIEKDLISIIDRKYWKKINHILVVHGRNTCIARRPKCDICPIKDICMKND